MILPILVVPTMALTADSCCGCSLCRCEPDVTTNGVRLLCLSGQLRGARDDDAIEAFRVLAVIAVATTGGLGENKGTFTRESLLKWKVLYG